MAAHDSFLNPTCSRSTLDLYQWRKSILHALVEQLPGFEGTFLDVGCGRMPYKPLIVAPPSRIQKYIGMDLRMDKYGQPDLKWDGQKIPLEACSVQCAMATEVLEHCPEPEIVLREVARVLAPNGLFFFTVPFLWPLHDAPYDEYRYTPFALERHLRNAGFENIKLKSLGGWNASLAQMIGLWICRSPMGKLKRQILSALAMPIVRGLVKHDQPPAIFTDQTMITGIAGTAIKTAK